MAMHAVASDVAGSWDRQGFDLPFQQPGLGPLKLQVITLAQELK